MLSSAWFSCSAETVCTKHLLRLSRPRRSSADLPIRGLETIPCPHAGPLKRSARRPVGDVQLGCELGGGAEQSSSILQGPDLIPPSPSLWSLWAARSAVQGAAGNASGVFHSSGRIHRPLQGRGWRFWATGGLLKAERERVSNHKQRLPGFSTMDLDSAQSRTDVPSREILGGIPLTTPVRRQVHPLSSLNCDELLQIEGSAAKQHIEDGAAELGGQDSQSLALAVLALQTREELLTDRVGP